MELSSILLSAFWTVVGAFGSWAISSRFYKKQLKDQQQSEEKRYNEKLLEQQRQQIRDEQQRQETEYRAERERMYQRRLERYRQYEPKEHGFEITLGADSNPFSVFDRPLPDSITIKNVSEEEFYAVSLEFPWEVSGRASGAVFGRIGNFPPGQCVTLSLPESVPEPEAIFIRGNRPTTSVPMEVRVPLDPNFIMREYRESGNDGHYRF